MKVLLVGGGGFIGSSVAKALIAENVETTILDNFSSQFQERKIKGADVVEGDISNKDALKSAIKGVTHVWHGAYPHNIDSRVDEVGTVWKNIEGTIQLGKIARQSNVEKFVYASSRSVYGNAQYNPIDEEHPVQPVTAYGLCKAVCEAYLAEIFAESKTRLCVLRGFLVYGPGDRQSVVTKFAKMLLKGKSPVVHGDGSATRDFIHVADMARATVLALKLKAIGTFNIGSGEETSLLRLIRLLGIAMGREDIAPEFIQKDAWNVNDRCYAHIGAAKEILGFNPSVSLQDGLHESVEALKS